MSENFTPKQATWYDTTIKAKQFLVTVYVEESETEDNFVLDTNTDDEYDYTKCITKVIGDHLKSVNDVRIVDVAVDRDKDKIIKLIKGE